MALNAYRAVFRTPGTAAFSGASFVMRSAIALYPIGLVLLVSLRTGQYGFAGLLSGVYVLANGAGNPVLGRLVDRYGQTRLLLPVTAVHIAGVMALVVLVETSAPDVTLLPAAAVAGFFYMAVGSLVRARWSFVLDDRNELSTAYSLESTLDEVIFVVGPLVATVIATQSDPAYVLVLGCLVVGGGAFWLTRLPDTAPPPHPVGGPRSETALRFRGVPTLVIGMLACGGFFASAEISIIAFCSERGSAGISGAVLACLAGGSGAAGFVYGARHWRAPLLTRYLVQCGAFGLLPFLFLLAVNVPALAVISFVVGSAAAPTLITGMGLIERIVPDRSLTEGIAWMTTGLCIGYGALAAVVGRIADAEGARSGFLVAIGCGLLAAAVALVLYRRLRGAPLPGDAAAAADADTPRPRVARSEVRGE